MAVQHSYNAITRVCVHFYAAKFCAISSSVRFDEKVFCKCSFGLSETIRDCEHPQKTKIHNFPQSLHSTTYLQFIYVGTSFAGSFCDFISQLFMLKLSLHWFID